MTNEKVTVSDAFHAFEVPKVVPTAAEDVLRIAGYDPAIYKANPNCVRDLRERFSQVLDPAYRLILALSAPATAPADVHLTFAELVSALRKCGLLLDEEPTIRAHF